MRLSAAIAPTERAPGQGAARVPLRICHVMSADLWAGAEVQLATTAAFLARQPDVLLSAVLFNDGPLAEALRRIRVPVTVLDETRLGPVAIVRRLSHHLRTHRVEIVHTHRYKDSVLGSIAVRLAGVPHFVRTVHGFREPMAGLPRIKFGIYDALDRVALFWCADLIVAVSRQMADELRRTGFRPTMVTHIHNGIDTASVVATRAPEEVRRALGIDPRALVIGTAGRLVPVKDQATLIRAMQRIRKAEPAARLLVVGGGPLLQELQSLAVTLGVADACLFAGPRSDVYDLIAAMDVFTLPSLSEGIPMALLEAMALGRPVVASRVGGIPEIIRHRVSGWLVPPSDDAELADACLTLGRHRELAAQMAAAGRHAVLADYSEQHCGLELLQAYHAIAGPRHRRHHGTAP